MSNIQTDLMNPDKVQKAYQSVFAGHDAELVMEHLCQQGFVYQPTFVRGDRDEMLLNEGARRLVLSIIKRVNFTPNQLPKQLTTTAQGDDQNG